MACNRILKASPQLTPQTVSSVHERQIVDRGAATFNCGHNLFHSVLMIKTLGNVVCHVVGTGKGGVWVAEAFVLRFAPVTLLRAPVRTLEHDDCLSP